MAQIYMGKKSVTFTEINGMRHMNQMPETLKNFFKQWGVPSGLLSNLVKTKTSKAIKKILKINPLIIIIQNYWKE